MYCASYIFIYSYICYVEESRPPLWSSGQSSWLQIQIDSRRYQIFWQLVGLERGLLSLVSTIEELLERKSSGCGLESRDNGRGDSMNWPRDTFNPQKLPLTLPTSAGRSIGTFRSRTQITGYFSKVTSFSVALWDTVLQSGRSWVRFPMRFFLLNSSSRTIDLESTRPLTGTSIRHLPWCKERSALEAVSFTAICEPMVYKMSEYRRLTKIWASTAWYRDSITLLPLLKE
jgi:hypothetical protein